MLVNNTKSIFDVPVPQEIIKKEFLKKLKAIVESGGEISWFTTDVQSFEWADINSDIKNFLKEVSLLEFGKAGIGIFYPKTKRTKYESFNITKSEE